MPRLLVPGLLLLLACSGREFPAHAPPEGPEVWVATDAPPDGTGSRTQPLQELREALERGAGVRVRLLPGRHRGPVRLPPDAQLLGEGEGVVIVGGVEVPAGGKLRGLALEGGTWGLVSAGALVLEDVALHGQQDGAVRIAAGTLRATRLRLGAPASPRAAGLWLGAGVRARVEDLRLEGPFFRGLELMDAEQVELEQLQASGAATVLFQRGGEVHLQRAALGGGAGPGLVVTAGTLVLEDVVVLGHEYALQAGKDSTLRVRGFASLGAERAGLALVASHAQLEDVQVLGAGSFGALQLLNSRVRLRYFGIQDAQDYGLSATQGRLEASAGRVVRTRGNGSESGDALHLRDLDAHLHTLRVAGAGGLGLLVAEGAQAQVQDVELRACQAGGALAETRGQLRVRALRVHGSAPPALAVMSGAQATLEQVALDDGGDPGQLLWVDCAHGAGVHVGAGVPAVLRAPCLTRQAPPLP